MGKKHGDGYYIWQDGSTYKGQWYENDIEGNGDYQWNDGRKGGVQRRVTSS